MKYIGYHRATVRQPDTTYGAERIRQYCNEKQIRLYKNEIFIESRPGYDFGLPIYQMLKQEVLLPEDTLIITEAAQLGRSKSGILKELEFFQKERIWLRILELPSTLSGSSKEMVSNLLMEVYTSLAEEEFRNRKKRQREAINNMRINGNFDRYGRPPVLDKKVFALEFEEVLHGKLTPGELQKKLNLKRPTYYKYRKEYMERNKEYQETNEN